MTEAPEGEPPEEENYFSILKLLRKEEGKGVFDGRRMRKGFLAE